jgi:hypothetical protein
MQLLCKTGALVLVQLALLATVAAAQGTSGVIVGTIVDTQGAVLPGVTITVRNIDTGAMRTLVTGADGQYRVAALPSGRYDVRAELSGFTTAEAKGVPLLINQEVRQNLTMNVGALQESVTVTGEAPVVETTKTEVAAVITQQQIETLPVANRAAVTLALLLPGTSQDGTRPRRNNAQVGAGTLQFTSNALADGTMNMSTKAGEPRQDFPQAAIREFKVLTSQAPAEYGGRAGGVVSIVTKAGTNAFSGEAFEFFRNQSMQRVDVFKQAQLDATGESKPDYTRNQFGAALGGPIIKDRLQFFVAAEHTKEAQEYFVNTGKPEFYAALEGLFPTSTIDNLFFVRADAQLTPTQNVFARWGYQGNFQHCEGCGGSVSPASAQDTYIPRDSFVAGHTWVLSSRLLNEARFQWAQQFQHSSPHDAPLWKTFDFPPERFQHVTPTYDFPSVSWGSDDYFNHHAMIREFRDDFSISSSSHNWKFGGSFQNIPIEEDVQGNNLGTWTFANDQYFDPNDPASLASLKGPINTFTAAFPPLVRRQPHHYYQMYAQDEWRAASGLTLNLGLRYDLDTLVWNRDRQMSYYPRPLVSNGKPLVDFASRGDNDNVSPRIGVAWDVRNDGKTVVRAGAGRQYNVIMNGVPGGETTTLLQTSINIRNPSYPDPYGGRSPASFASTAPPNISIVSDDLVNPYSDTYSAGVSRELAASMAIHLDGVYTHTDKFNANVQINTPPDPANTGLKPYPEWGRITQAQSIGAQDYKALLARLEKRLSNRNQFTVSYTLAKTTDNSFGNTSTGTITDLNHPELDEGYGNADRRHALVASGAALVPGDITIGMVWTYRTNTPFSARAGRDLNADGSNTDYVPGTHKGQGNRDTAALLAAVNTWRAVNGRAPIPEAQVTDNDYNRFDVRVSKAIALGAARKVEVIGQVFNVFGRDNYGGIGSSRQINALSDSFGRYLQAQPRQQAEIAIRMAF